MVSKSKDPLQDPCTPLLSAGKNTILTETRKVGDVCLAGNWRQPRGELAPRFEVVCVIVIEKAA